MKTKVLSVLLLFLCLGSVFCREASADHENVSFRAVIASDLHYVAPELTDGGAAWQRVLENGDSKFMPYIEEITDAFIDEVLAEHPDVVLLTGDLTFNGAELSHRSLCQKLRKIEEAGIPVLVLPGNHDVYNVNAARYLGENYERVPFATSESFAQTYREFGPGEALSMDSDSLSYVWIVNDRARIMMLDENTIHDFCGVSDQTFGWIEDQLREAREKDCFVLVAGHQNLFQHSIFDGGYVIDGSERLRDLFREYGIPLCLSGHLHTQHIRTENGLTEIATSALCSYPCRYAVLTVDEDHIHYETRRLDLAAWAERNGRSEPVYRNFAESAGQYMDAHFTPNGMEPVVDDPALWAEMLGYLRSLNRAYFSGDLRGIGSLDPDGRLSALWAQEGGLTAMYVQSILNEADTDHTAWDSKHP
jgi:3',5'-cyclic AMP phosphodiesterase CpdA